MTSRDAHARQAPRGRAGAPHSHAPRPAPRSAPRSAIGGSDIAVAVTGEAWSDSVPDGVQICRQAAAATLARLGLHAGAVEVSVVLAEDDFVRRLNREHRGRDRPTNVLAFPAAPPPEPGRSGCAGDADGGAPGARPILLGDVVVGRETILKEAAEQHKRVADHLCHLVVHGVLHLLRHDHDTSARARDMEILETAILDGLGVSDPYRPARATGHEEP